MRGRILYKSFQRDLLILELLFFNLNSIALRISKKQSLDLPERKDTCRRHPIPHHLT